MAACCLGEEPLQRGSIALAAAHEEEAGGGFAGGGSGDIAESVALERAVSLLSGGGERGEEKGEEEGAAEHGRMVGQAGAGAMGVGNKGGGKMAMGPWRTLQLSALPPLWCKESLPCRGRCVILGSSHRW